jgi:hypothetical protein
MATYDSAKQFINSAAATAFGTNSAVVELLQVRFPVAVTVEALIANKSGGTDAAAQIYVINKSLAGTGSVTAIGTATAAANTAALYTSTTGTITVTNYAAGDVMTVTKIGTSTATSATVCVQFREQF